MTNLYLWEDREWVITSMSSTTFGVWISNGDVRRLTKGCAVEELGLAALDSLDASKVGVPHPADWLAFRRAYVKSLGVKSVDRFEAKCRLVGVTLAGPSLTVTPTKNGGTKNGFTPLGPKSSLESYDKTSLGQAIVDCVSRCE